jgi:antitoxin (DNA-binding transcriptional repressor) of toxin-antitoxin stability system
MKRIDLDDVPPKLAALLTGTEPGEEVLLVRDGLVVGRLTGGAQGGDEAEPHGEAPSAERAKEIFEQFRSVVEDEF